VYRADEQDEVTHSRFSERDTTSGLPDDSREEDERQKARKLRELRARLKRARAIVARTPGLAESIRRDWKRAAQFYARLRVNEVQLRRGAPSSASRFETIRGTRYAEFLTFSPQKTRRSLVKTFAQSNPESRERRPGRCGYSSMPHLGVTPWESREEATKSVAAGSESKWTGVSYRSGWRGASSGT
jgi:hypothetical protein